MKVYIVVTELMDEGICLEKVFSDVTKAGVFVEELAEKTGERVVLHEFEVEE